LRADLEASIARLTALLEVNPFNAPEQTELGALRLGRQELGAAANAGAILRLPGDIVLLPNAPQQAATVLRGLPQPFTLSAARQALSTTRRVAVPLLEHLDRIGLTERVDQGLRRLRA
jgi:selenocysteine-specific elongation factor